MNQRSSKVFPPRLGQEVVQCIDTHISLIVSLSPDTGQLNKNILPQHLYKYFETFGIEPISPLRILSL